MNALSVTKRTAARIPTPHKDFQLMLLSNNQDTKEQLALVMRIPEDRPTPQHNNITICTQKHNECRIY